MALSVVQDFSAMENRHSSSPTELLNRLHILNGLSESVKKRLVQLDILETVDSTNRYVLERGHRSGTVVCLAESQTAGRGRQGRPWVSPYGRGIYLSLKYDYQNLNFPISGVSIASAVTVVRVLRNLGASKVGVKWPNDIVWEGCKVGGLLLESRTVSENILEIVVGIGINVKMPPLENHFQKIDQPWTDLYHVLGYEVSRNDLAARLIDQGIETLASYGQTGLRNFLQEWQSFDMIYGRSVSLIIPSAKSCQASKIVGIACGIDQEGALLLQVGNRQERYVYGEVSVRL